MVVGCDLNEEGAGQTLQQVGDGGGTMVSMHPCNLVVREQVDQLIEMALEAYGGIDVLYNNAAMAYFDWLSDMAYETWSKTLREELDIVFHACQAVYPHMLTRGAGSIINTASVSAKMAYKVLPGLAHSAAKGGVLAMSRQIAMEGGKHGIRCNTISPGVVLTAQTEPLLDNPDWAEPMRGKLMLDRFGRPEDIAPLAVYLASDESSWVTGADFAVDGGTTAW